MESKARKFLEQLFYQCLASVDFYYSCMKLGVNPETWPSGFVFDAAKRFFNMASSKTYNAAIIEIDFKIPDSAYADLIEEEEIKLFYSEYLSYLRALDLSKKLAAKPEMASELCNDFLNKKTTVSKKVNLSQAVLDFTISNEQKIKSGDSDVELSSFPCLSKAISGFNKGRVTIITAHSGFGKTNWGLNFLKAGLIDNKKILYINMEMVTEDMTKRFLQSYCGLNSYVFKTNDYIQKISNVQNITDRLSTSWITDGSQMSISEIAQMTSELKRQQGLDFLVVDYDQKIIMPSSGFKDEWQSLLKAVEALEAISKKYEIHVVLFAQTNDEKDGVPVASRRSIQPASAVIHFHKDGEKTVLKFIKNRFGSTSEKIELNYRPELSLITEIGFLKEEVLPPPVEKKGFKNVSRMF